MVIMCIVKTALVRDVVPAVDKGDHYVVWRRFLIVGNAHSACERSPNKLHQTLEAIVLPRKQVEIAFVKAIAGFRPDCNFTVNLLCLLTLQAEQKIQNRRLLLIVELPTTREKHRRPSNGATQWVICCGCHRNNLISTLWVTISRLKNLATIKAERCEIG